MTVLGWKPGVAPSAGAGIAGRLRVTLRTSWPHFGRWASIQPRAATNHWAQLQRVALALFRDAVRGPNAAGRQMAPRCGSALFLASETADADLEDRRGAAVCAVNAC